MENNYEGLSPLTLATYLSQRETEVMSLSYRIEELTADRSAGVFANDKTMHDQLAKSRDKRRYILREIEQIKVALLKEKYQPSHKWPKDVGSK